ncbi:MAG: FAD binding domain-containing protein [Kofleriaceae bacterium]|nr:FAD binding domain-containing protein [Kofleriaceae bacterium]
MLRLPVFGSAAPTTISELVAQLSKPGARLVAGGTDLLPNLKHGLEAPSTLVSTDRVESLREVSWHEDKAELHVGASVTLSDIASDKKIVAQFPSFAQAAGLVASPLIRNMATIGGNINLDTRCRYVNQSEFWRSSIGGCLKAAGDVCHVVPKGRSCVAAMSSDCVPALISLGAELLQSGRKANAESLWLITTITKAPSTRSEKTASSPQSSSCQYRTSQVAQVTPSGAYEKASISRF